MEKVGSWWWWWCVTCAEIAKTDITSFSNVPKRVSFFYIAVKAIIIILLCLITALLMSFIYLKRRHTTLLQFHVGFHVDMTMMSPKKSLCCDENPSFRPRHTRSARTTKRRNGRREARSFSGIIRVKRRRRRRAMWWMKRMGWSSIFNSFTVHFGFVCWNHCFECCYCEGWKWGSEAMCL